MPAANPPQGWSKAAARRAGRTWRPPVADEDCYYCGVPGCEECGRPPALLATSDLIIEDRNDGS